MVSQFLVAFLQWRVLNDALHHIVGAVYAEPLLLVPNISFGVLDYGEVKKKKDLWLATPQDVY